MITLRDSAGHEVVLLGTVEWTMGRPPARVDGLLDLMGRAGSWVPRTVQCTVQGAGRLPRTTLPALRGRRLIWRRGGP